MLHTVVSFSSHNSPFLCFTELTTMASKEHLVAVFMAGVLCRLMLAIAMVLDPALHRLMLETTTIAVEILLVRVALRML